MATKYLLLGHTKIAYLGGHWPTSSNLERLEGYKRALEEAGIEMRDEYIYQASSEWKTVIEKE